MPISTFLNGRPPTRGLQWLALSESGVLLTLTSTSDSGGGATQSWAAAGTYDCRIDPLAGGQSRVTGGAIDERSTHLATIPTGATVSEQQRFAVSGRGTFEVTAVRHRTGQFTQVFEILEIS